jgi:hypothetical protein
MNKERLKPTTSRKHFISYQSLLGTTWISDMYNLTISLQKFIKYYLEGDVIHVPKGNAFEKKC